MPWHLDKSFAYTFLRQVAGLLVKGNKYDASDVIYSIHQQYLRDLVPDK